MSDDLPTYREAGNGPLLVFLHGISGNRHSFDDQLPAFADRWHCVAWDMPGYGGSTLPDGGLSFAAISDALARLLDHFGAERAAVVGHSMGGMVAQDFVARHPERVGALVLSATSPAFGKPGGDWQKRFLAERLQPLDEGRSPADIAESVVAGMFGDEPDPAAIARAAAIMATLPAETYRAALHCIVEFDRREALERIACPTLCLAAENDRNAPPAVMERMAAKIPGSRYHCMAKLGHLANVEDPMQFNEAVRGFLIEAGA